VTNEEAIQRVSQPSKYMNFIHHAVNKSGTEQVTNEEAIQRVSQPSKYMNFIHHAVNNETINIL